MRSVSQTVFVPASHVSGATCDDAGACQRYVEGEGCLSAFSVCDGECDVVVRFEDVGELGEEVAVFFETGCAVEQRFARCCPDETDECSAVHAGLRVETPPLAESVERFLVGDVEMAR